MPEKPMVKFGQNMTLGCFSKPISERITWTYYNRSLPPNARADRQFLHFHNTSLINAGVYVCNVRTAVGTGTAQVPLVVEPGEDYVSKAHSPNLHKENNIMIIIILLLL